LPEKARSEEKFARKIKLSNQPFFLGPKKKNFTWVGGINIKICLFEALNFGTRILQFGSAFSIIQTGSVHK
jgi:hypothetical protein